MMNSMYFNFSSPHLVEVRERIRINGKIIDKEDFARYFWKCWDNFKQVKLFELASHFFKMIYNIAFVNSER